MLPRKIQSKWLTSARGEGGGESLAEDYDHPAVTRVLASVSSLLLHLPHSYNNNNNNNNNHTLPSIAALLSEMRY